MCNTGGRDSEEIWQGFKFFDVGRDIAHVQELDTAYQAFASGRIDMCQVFLFLLTDDFCKINNCN